LKGSDAGLGQQALWAGAIPRAHERAKLALQAIAAAPVELITSAGPMGEDAARSAGLEPHVVHRGRTPTTAADTVTAARTLAEAGVDVLAFAGGDGTARDLVQANLGELPVLGIPAGVKMHSAVFATSPAAAGAALAALAGGATVRTQLADVIDRNPAIGAPILYGCLRTPTGARLQAAKATAPVGSDAELLSAARVIAGELRSAELALVGPGATMMLVKDALGGGSLLGVDVFANGSLLMADADQRTLQELVRERPVRLVLGVIGGQGFLLGRGNQQISSDIVRSVGRENLIVAAAAEKLAALPGGALLVDSGDAEVDRLLAGYVRVRTGARRHMMMRIDPA
jgi:predicted polyphosphate/ATP-dependent NAD kinase